MSTLRWLRTAKGTLAYQSAGRGSKMYQNLVRVTDMVCTD